MSTFRGSATLQNLIDKLTGQSTPIIIEVIPDLVLSCYPVTGDLESWIDRGVDSTNRLTIIRSLGQRTLALATSHVNGVPVYEELGFNLQPYGLDASILQAKPFNSWPAIVREGLADALFQYLSVIPSTILDPAYNFYTAKVEEKLTNDIVGDLEQSANKKLANMTDSVQTPVGNTQTAKPVAPTVSIAHPNEHEIPGVRTATHEQIVGYGNR